MVMSFRSVNRLYVYIYIYTYNLYIYIQMTKVLECNSYNFSSSRIFIMLFDQNGFISSILVLFSYLVYYSPTHSFFREKKA
jgi:hypothetical protein